MKSKSYSFLIFYFLLVTSCVSENLQDEIDRINSCADLDRIAISEIAFSTDTTYFSGVINGKNFGIKPGSNNYDVRFLKLVVFSTSSNSAGEEQSASKLVPYLSFRQDETSRLPFPRNHRLSAIVQFPCADNTESSSLSALFRSYEVGTTLPILGRGGACEDGVTITLEAYCFAARSTTPLTTEAGMQSELNSFRIDRIEIVDGTDGSLTLELTARFTADPWYNTPAGGPIHFGKITNGRIGISEQMSNSIWRECGYGKRFRGTSLLPHPTLSKAKPYVASHFTQACLLPCKT